MVYLPPPWDTCATAPANYPVLGVHAREGLSRRPLRAPQRVPPASDIATPAPASLVAAMPPPEDVEAVDASWFSFLDGGAISASARVGLRCSLCGCQSCCRRSVTKRAI